MKFLSIDVGIKNLSFCLFCNNENTWTILHWDNVDLTQQNGLQCMETISTGGICGKPAKFSKDDKCYCLKHSKKCEYLLPQNDFQMPFLNKQTIQNLLKIADKYNILYEKPIKKPDLINIIHEFSTKKCFTAIAKINATKVDLVTIGRNIQYKFDAYFHEHFDSIDCIIIENQIGPLANKMKTLQGMLAQYFIMRNNEISIEFISSTNKLKDFVKKEDKLDYKQRKNLGIQTCLQIINSEPCYSNWVDFVKNHKKKDDLSDCFLQGLWYIKNKV